MSTDILERDSDIHFPHFIVLKASAGSGKTYALTQRFVQHILSDAVPENNLRNMLAITFTNNAAYEMKERILSWLKLLYFNDERTMDEFTRLVSLRKEEIAKKAHHLIEEILDSYADFQVKTIDSFMTSVFKASAIDFGYHPDFEILMDHRRLMKYAFDLYVRRVEENSEEASLMEEILSTILESKKGFVAYPWNPSPALLDTISVLYWKLSVSGKKIIVDHASQQIAPLKTRIRDTVESIETMIISSGLPRRKNSSFHTILSLVRTGRFPDLIGKGLTNQPVKKLQQKTADQVQAYTNILQKWSDLEGLIEQYALSYAHAFYAPYLKIFQQFGDVVESIKKQQGKVFIQDINRRLSEYLETSIVPDVYFRIGETIFHYLIDEFQDTSPIQWENLFPLIENSLSQRGSAFIVGDTKQAIYGFRHADYMIMKTFETQNPFPSALHSVRELTINYRSSKTILDLSKAVFKRNALKNDLYRECASRSGLSLFTQESAEKENEGYAEVLVVKRNDDNPPEREKILDIIADLCQRKFTYRDIAVLTQRNEDAVIVTTWLNEKDIPFISYSSLDIRRRKITGEIMALLKFLDSPTDDLSFITFILGEIFSGATALSHHDIEKKQLMDFCFTSRENRPCYKFFQRNFENLWETYFSELFKSSGYLPLYDLIVHIFHVFRIFSLFPHEEATLVKILETVKDFEGAGHNSITDFLDFAANGEANADEWNMNVPKDTDAITVMTIHKAKGLGFPVVIVLLYGDHVRGVSPIIQEDRDGLRLLRITKDIARSNASLAKIYDEEIKKEMVNKMNALYVAFTRPKAELYVIGVSDRHAGSYPLNLLPSEDFQQKDKPLNKPGKKLAGKTVFRTTHYHELMTIVTSPGQSLNIDERKYGEYIHKILSCIDFIEEGFEKTLKSITEKVADQMSLSYNVHVVTHTLHRVLSTADIAVFFRKLPGRIILREQDFCNKNGKMYRMDRVILDHDAITVLDYKTGTDNEPGIEMQQEMQIKTYMNILRELFPEKHVEGVIIYIDKTEIKRFA